MIAAGRRPIPERRPAAGFALVEVPITTAIAAVLVLALGEVVNNTLAVNDDTRERDTLAYDARFAMRRMVIAVSASSQLVLPIAENDSTFWSESIRDPGVLAVGLDPTLDQDLDVFADADNDKDGAIDEDLPSDVNNDGKPGIRGIDDSNNGFTDASLGGSSDDDEAGPLFTPSDDDPVNGIDDDGDDSIDEDPSSDMNGDGAPGIALFDDDGDGNTDEGTASDDDEDGLDDEDWLDTVVYFLSGSDLIERHPDLSPVDGTDFTERVIAQNVQSFRVERLPRGVNRADLVDISLGLGTEKVSVSVQQRVRVGGAQ